MNRGQAERWLSRYLDGELDAERSALLERQLAADPTLRAQADAWRTEGQRLRALDGDVPDPAREWGELRTRIAQERAEEAAAPGRLPVFGSRWSWAAAMLILLLAAAGVRLLLPGGSPEKVAARNTMEHAAADEVVEWAETDVPGASTMVFRDEETGLTVIWLVENDETESEHAGS